MQLLLYSKNHNGLRYFPHSGYLGMSNVVVEGVVATKLDADMKPLPAKQITVSVRCYEFQLGRLGGVVSSRVVVDQTLVLWTRPDFEDLGEAEHPFKIVVPPGTGGLSTLSFVEYKCVWRCEATITHAHISGIGSKMVKHIDIPLVRYDLPTFPTSSVLSHRMISKAKASTLRYLVIPPKSPIGPTDLLPITVQVLPTDQNAVIRSATVVIERRIQFNDIQHSPLSASAAPISIPPSPSVSSLASYSPPSAAASSISLATDILTRPLLPLQKYRITRDSSESLTVIPPPSSAQKTIVLPIAGSESSGPFSRAEDGSGAWTKTLTVQWPSAKPSSRWGIGETVLGSDLVSIRFFAKVKIIVTTPHSTESYELDDEEVFVTCTSHEERKLALTKVQSRSRSSDARSKSKSPRRTRRKREATPEHTDGEQSVASTSAAPPPVPRTPRRPHTSAGPRDQSHGFSSNSSFFSSPPSAYSLSTSRSHSLLASPTPSGSLKKSSKRPATVSHTSDTNSGSSQLTQLTRSNAFGRVFSPNSTSSFSSAPKITSAPSTSSSGSSTSAASTLATSVTSISEEDDALVKEWEAELAQIEVKSRRSSDLLGFGWIRGGLRSNKRKRALSTTAKPPARDTLRT